ncbi:hypothetical protein IWZ00DRAFT_278646 [Phyllosticta capitalensis]|uniref:uncharacterized protein n=1 Tax=Phyllosticta capitalensis TaxID=121624 RepID=UPI00312F2D3E
MTYLDDSAHMWLRTGQRNKAGQGRGQMGGCRARHANTYLINAGSRVRACLIGDGGDAAMQCGSQPDACLLASKATAIEWSFDSVGVVAFGFAASCLVLIILPKTTSIIAIAHLMKLIDVHRSISCSPWRAISLGAARIRCGREVGIGWRTAHACILPRAAAVGSRGEGVGRYVSRMAQLILVK